MLSSDSTHFVDSSFESFQSLDSELKQASILSCTMYHSMQCIAMQWQCNVPCITKSLPITFSYLSPLVAGFSLVCLNFPQFFPPLSLVSILQPSSSKMSLSRCGISYSSYSLGISSLQQSSFH